MGTGTCHQSIDTSAKNAKKDGGYSYYLIGVSEFLARTRAYIKFFTLATVATLQHFLKISMLRVTTR